jgi:hypothetical protein
MNRVVFMIGVFAIGLLALAMMAPQGGASPCQGEENCPVWPSESHSAGVSVQQSITSADAGECACDSNNNCVSERACSFTVNWTITNGTAASYKNGFGCLLWPGSLVITHTASGCGSDKANLLEFWDGTSCSGTRDAWATVNTQCPTNRCPFKDC